MSEENMKTVNIRVPADVWNGIDDNKSEICRQALRARVSRKARGDVQKLSDEYERARDQLREKEAEMEVKKQMLFQELKEWNYEQYVIPEDHPEDLGEFEETVLYASRYAETYLDSDYDKEITVHEVRQDLMKEGRDLPKGVAEWVVDRVSEKI